MYRFALQHGGNCLRGAITLILHAERKPCVCNRARFCSWSQRALQQQCLGRSSRFLPFFLSSPSFLGCSSDSTFGCSPAWHHEVELTEGGGQQVSEGQLLRRQEDGKLPNVSHPVYIFFQEKCQPLQQWNLIGAVGSSLFLIQLNARRCSARCLLDSNFLSSLCDSGN